MVEGINLKIPWLFDCKLDFRFKGKLTKMNRGKISLSTFVVIPN